MLNLSYRALCLLVLSVGLLAACQATPSFECTDAIGCVDISPGEPIKIGAIQTLSGGVGPYGQELFQSTKVAVAERQGELLGHSLELYIEDDFCTGEGGTTAALKLVADPQIVAVIGTTCSGAAVTAAKIVSNAGLVMVSGANTAPSLTAIEDEKGADWQPGYFRTAHNDVIQGRAAATFAFEELHITRAATINDGDLYTRGLTEVFNRVFEELGGTIVRTTAVNKGDSNMRPVLASVADSEAQLVFFPIFQPEADFIVKQAGQIAGFEDIILMTAEGVMGQPFIDSIGQDGLATYFVGPATPFGPAYENFVANYERQYGQAPTTPYHAHTYDAANLVFDAIKKVAVQEKDGTLHIGRQALRDALYATSGYAGLTGTLACDQFGDCGSARFKVVRLDDPAAGIEALINNIVYTYEPDQIARQE